MNTLRFASLALLVPLSLACAADSDVVDVLFLGGSVVDGSGSAAVTADVAIQEDRIWYVGDASLTGGYEP